MNFFQSLAETFAGKPIDWDELEEALIRADLGVPTTTRILKTLQDREAWSLLGIKDVVKVAQEELLSILPKQSEPIRPIAGKPKTILIVGVNGTGKTTSTAKLARYLQQDRWTVLLAAADTFRAAAIEQLGIWAERLGVEMIRGHYNADPAANLMAELNKMKRSLAKHDPEAPHETLLVVDATTGGNALSQAREFHQAIGLTGLIVTKLDGSGKGGIVIAIQEELGIPTRFVGTGEKLEDFKEFNARDFIADML
jgi:fused signal recognition particle receptor